MMQGEIKGNNCRSKVLETPGLTVHKNSKYFFHCYRRVDRLGVTDVRRLVDFSERR